jgi:ribosomal protein L40E
MSSATSIEKVRLKPDVAQPDSDADPGFRPWHFFVLASLAAATAAVVMSRRSSPEHLILVSLTIGAAGAAAAGLYRMLAPLAIRDVSRLRDRPSERMRAALEREKSLVLRSIKELEFDRAMGKLSPKDFEEMGSRLRARAMMLMKQLDAGGSGYGPLIERELSARLATRSVVRLKPETTGAQPVRLKPDTTETSAVRLKPETTETSAVPLKPPFDRARGGPELVEGPDTAETAESRTKNGCAACGTANDPDASFCKRCGTRLEV